jgi:FkbM family methyltransferase
MADKLPLILNMTSTFHVRLLRQLASGLQTHQVNNTDHLRYPASTRSRIIDGLLGWLASARLFRHTAAISQVVDQHIATMEPHMDGFAWLYERLADETSRQTLIEVLAFRLLGSRHIRISAVHEAFWKAVPVVCTEAVEKRHTQSVSMLDGWLDDFDLKHHGYPVRLRAHRLNVMNTFLLEQYRFKAPGVNVGVKPEDVVIDGGGCWGDTALYFADQVGEKGKVHVFEFSPANLTLLNRNLGENPVLRDRIQVHQAALWDNSTDTLDFDEAGPGTTLGSGGLHARTRSIDEWAATEKVPKIDFIKMDIEGAEGKALSGARETIHSQGPRLAVALYHALEDFIKLPQLIDEIAPGYRFHLGHYTIHHEETMLFATR